MCRYFVGDLHEGDGAVQVIKMLDERAWRNFKISARSHGVSPGNGELGLDSYPTKKEYSRR